MTHRFVLLAAAAIALAGAAYAQEPQPRMVRIGPGGEGPPQPALPNTPENRRLILGRLAATLEQNYVFPEVAQHYAQALRAKTAAGGYDNLGDRLGETVTADLQAIHADRHIRFGPTGAGPRRMMRTPDAATAIGRSGWIADGVAYIDIGLFPGTEESVERFRAFLEAHRDARAVIFDIRNHHGGGPAEMNVIFSYLFPRETLLAGMDSRAGPERGGNRYHQAHALCASRPGHGAAPRASLPADLAPVRLRRRAFRARAEAHPPRHLDRRGDGRRKPFRPNGRFRRLCRLRAGRPHLRSGQ